jgi:hypothetical protein
MTLQKDKSHPPPSTTGGCNSRLDIPSKQRGGEFRLFRETGFALDLLLVF